MKKIENVDVLDSLMHLARLTRRYQGGGRDGRRNSSHSEAKLLHILQDNDNMSAKELAEKMDIRPPSLSEALDRLEKRGEVARFRDENDYRVYRINLTEKGRQEMEKLTEEYAKTSQEVEACLTDEEKRIFCDICGKLRTHLTALAGNSKKRNNVKREKREEFK